MITLTTDFGLEDPYVAQMKGVILSINADSNLIDISHSVKKFDVRMGAFTLASAAPYFPKGTVHLAVVDPGVGTKRRSVMVQTKQAFFVGPDNGILMLAAKSQGIEHVYDLSNSPYRLPKISSTFHGRDIFAPAAAYLDQGVKPFEFGPEIIDPLTPKFAETTRKNTSLYGEVLHIDSFGNIVTNIAEKDISNVKTVKVKLAECSLEATFAKTYGEVNLKDPIALVGSHGFLEFAVNQGNAAEKYNVHSGELVTITFS
jgi:S-adenosyl-L-methionine hydrolase (adenosine-forming)